MHVFIKIPWLSRVASVSVLAEDNVIAKYDKHKADQTGEKLHEKHLFDNPFDPLVSLFLALGVYLSLELGSFEQLNYCFKMTPMKQMQALSTTAYSYVSCSPSTRML